MPEEAPKLVIGNEAVNELNAILGTRNQKKTASSVLQMDHDGDPVQQLIDSVGDLSANRLAGPQLLVAVYIRPNKTKSGLYVTDKFTQEDEWQGKVCLVLKKGAGAFVDDPTHKFYGFTAEVGEWIVTKSVAGLAHHLNGVPCKIVEDSQVLEVIPTPDQVY